MAADKTTVRDVVKERLGFKTTVRDTYLLAIVDGVIHELAEEKGLSIDLDNPYQFMFVVDYATWRYQNRDSDAGMPRHLQFRMHNLMIHVGSSSLTVNNILSVVDYPVAPVTYTVYVLPDGTQNMYISGAWTEVALADGVWTVVAT